MTTREVSIERHVKQVRDGVQYDGYVKINEVTFDYDLVFGVPIKDLDNVEPTEDPNEIRRLFQLKLKRDGANIELTGDEYGLFLQLVVELAIGFHDNGQTRDSNEGAMGQALRGTGPMSVFGVSVSIGWTRKSSYDFTPELCKLLSTSKFGCRLVD